MAKDDYDYIVFRILVYLYGCFKRKISFEEAAFEKLLVKGIQEEYLLDVLQLMQKDGLVEGLVFVRAWGGEHVLANRLADMRITAAGIRWLQENDSMRRIRKSLLGGAPGAILELVRRAF